MSATDFLLDFALASAFIMVGQFIRAKVKFVQNFFIPASMLAGFLALILGTQGFNVLFFSDSISSYPGLLIILIFSAVGIGGFSVDKKNIKAEIGRIGSYFSYKVLAQAIQFSLPVLFSIVVISNLFPNINYGFGLLLASGFTGGHGTAAAVGSAMANLGFADAKDIGMTCATVGILSGIFGGLAFIKVGTKRGWTKYIKDFNYISGDLKTGLVAKENRKPIGTETVSSIVLDPIAWHLAILLVCSGIGVLLYRYIYEASNHALDLPTYLLAFLTAFVMFLIFKATGVNNYIDPDTISRISGSATDYLVFFGIASIKIEVIVKYAVPLAMLLLFGMAIVFATLMFFGPAMNRGSWFERSIFVFGYSTGVFAIGFILLRIVDPENRSKTLNDTALAGPLTTPIEMFAWGMGPAMLLGGQHWAFVGLYTLVTVACIVLNLICRWWWLKLPLDRPAEGEDQADRSLSR
ncbi:MULTISPECIES: sodium/glutamate symporter [unclassified Oscillibacter]|uniref:sodium/glutamate symporter n=1 Tax=unclassified Oscillibacter TaxID=2629304 RepID=UPI0025D8D804|nr:MULTISPECIES: sodium/glutamate symporter [unclassified Oscillibacter]